MKDRYMVRKGFLIGALSGFFVAGSVLWGLPAVATLMPQHQGEPVIPSSSFLPIVRDEVPPEITWFFIQYPYVSAATTYKAKNRHTYVISDTDRQKEYVVQFGQRFRRVEIYTKGSNKSQIHVFMPGTKRTVLFQDGLIVSESHATEPNLWMWKSPLWNKRHIQIYSQADMWLNAPFKRYSCAGFVHRYLKDAKVAVPILDAWDMAKLPWSRVPVEEVEPGDILTFKAVTEQHRRFWGHSITHVGVYIGNGKFIHASTASHKAKRSWIRVADVQDFRHRIHKVLRPPELL